jgi:hypothetical protein
MAASLLDDPATLRLLGRGPLHAGRRKASKLIPRATTGAAASRPRSVGMASAAIGGGIPTPIDVAPHTTWRAVAATLRLPSHTRTMGRRLTALSHTAAARVQQLDAVRLDTGAWSCAVLRYVSAHVLAACVCVGCACERVGRWWRLQR